LEASPEAEAANGVGWALMRRVDACMSAARSRCSRKALAWVALSSLFSVWAGTAAALLGQTITFGALAGQTYGVAPFTIGATASSGLPVSFASLTTAVCTVSGNTVTIVAAGTCTIQASQAGNATYAAAPNVNQSFSVAKAAQTITFNALGGKTYGDPPFAVSATASSGLAVSFASTTSTICTVSGTTVTIVAAGTCSIKATQAGNANYLAATAVTQSFTVAKKAQTITFGALAGERMDQSPITVSATASSGLAVAFSSTTTTICTISGTTVTLKAVGTCTIQANQAGNANYLAATAVNQSFAVSKGNQTITFGALSNRALGTGTFTVSATASSALAVTFSSTTTAVCTVSGATVTMVAVGTCTIQAAQAGNANWNAAPNVPQSFSVTKGSQTINFTAPGNHALGSGTFTLTATATSGLTVTFASLTTSICTVNVRTVTLVAVGTCTIQASQAGNANWNAAPNVNQSFTVTPAVQTINFPAIPPQLWGPNTLFPSATASSGLPVAYASLTPSYCSVSGAVVTLVNIGSCTILATQAGNANYLPANASQTFAIIAPLQFAFFDSWATGSGPWGVAAGDFGNDGKADVAVLNTGDNTISLLFGAGDGSLVAGGALTGGNFPQTVAIGDLNGDGHPDLVVANARDNTIKIYLGNGNNTFAPPQTRSVRGSPTALALADLNGDGKLDLVVANGYTGDYSGNSTVGSSVEVFIGNGDGTFQPSTVYSVISNAQGVAIADVNADGKPDIVVTIGFSNAFYTLLGRGDGTFTTGVGYATGASPGPIAVADFNGDGKRDVIVANTQAGTLSLFLGNGNGTFAAPSTISVDTAIQGMVVADFNGDGRPDVAVTTPSGAYVLTGMGNGTFAPPTPLGIGLGTTSLTAADLNGDGRLDLITTDFSGTLAVFLNIGVVGSGATIVPQTGTPQSAAINAPFVTPLSVLVRGATNQPLPGESVVFIVPPGGPTGYFNPPQTQFTTDSNGIATASPFFAAATPGNFTVVATIGSASTNFYLTITGTANQAPAFVSSPLPNGALNAPYSYQVAASGSPAPTISTPAGSLPPGLTLDGITGLVSGTPNTAGTYLGSLTATNGTPPDATQSFNVTISSGATQTITFPAIANVTLGVAPFTISATASSGLPVTFTSTTTTICTVSGNTVTVVAAGTCTIQASQPGNSTYAAAPNVSRSFTVAKQSQTITFGTLFDRQLGSGTFTVSATASSGLAVTFSSLTTPVCTVSGTTVTMVTTGTCTIRAAQAGNANYAAAANVDQGFIVRASGTNQPPTIAFVTPASGNTYVAPAVVPLYVTASDPDGTIVKVEFYNGATLLGTATAVSYRYVWSNVAAGAYVITAKAYDNLGSTTTTANVNIVVNASGSGTSFWPQIYTNPLLFPPSTVAAGDVDGDGKVDIVVADSAFGAEMLRGNGTGIYASVDHTVYQPPYWATVSGGEALVVADFSGDGRRDVAVVNSSGLVTIFLGQANGTASAGVQYAIGPGATALAVADFNGDGKLDLVTANGDGTLSLLLGNGDGTFQPAITIATGATAALGGIVAGDFNGDGKQDILVADPGGADALLLLGNGNGTFQAARSVAAGSAPSRLAVADFNGDGKLDFASIVTDGNNVTVLLGNGDGTFQPAVDYPAGYLTQDLVTADFNGDGKPDIAVANVGVTSGVEVLLGNGNGTLQPPISIPFGTGATRLSTGDFNGDGRIDLAAINENSSPNGLAVLINTTGMIQQAPSFTNGVPPAGVAGTSYSFTFTASGTPAPRFTLTNFSGQFVPTGSWTFTNTGILSGGNQVTAGTFSGTVVATNGVAPDANYAFSIVVPELAQTINFPPLPDAVFPCPFTTLNVDNTDAANCSVTPAATASSGLGVTIRSLTPVVCDYVLNPISQLIEFKRLSVGTCILRAEQPGGGNYQAAPHVDRSFKITPKAPTVAILTPANGAGLVAPATITLTASARNVHLDAPTTRVEYYLNGTLINFSGTAPYAVTWPNLSAGTYTIFAREWDIISGGGGSTLGYSTDSVPITIVVAATADQPTVTVTAPSNNSLYFAPASVSLAATASNASGTIARVDFYNGALQVGSATSSPYTFVWSNVRPGTYTITAKATSGGGVVATSAPATITVDTGLATPIAALNFDDTWSSSGFIPELVSNAPTTRQGNVAQIAAPSTGAKPDTCKAANFTGGVIDSAGLTVSAIAGDATTTAFWMYWNGTTGAMPFSWATEGLLFSAGGFGFTTTGTDVYGIASASLANGWHYVVAVFVNGGVASNRLYIDGVQQSLTQRTGVPTVANAVVSGSLRLGGQSGTSALRFTGQIDEVNVFQGALSPSAVNSLSAVANPCAALKVEIIAPANNTAYNSPATIELTAVATNTAGPIGKIEYLNGSTVVGYVIGSGTTFAWTGVAAGTYTLRARVYDNVNGTGTGATSAPITVTVSDVTSAMTANVIFPPNGTTFYMDYPVHVVVAATAAPSTTIINAWGYTDDTEGILFVWYAAPNYRFVWRPTTAGTHTLTVRLQDSTGLWKTLPPVTVNMVTGSPSTVYYYNDLAGSPVAGTDPNGTLLWDGSYYPYGERFNAEDSLIGDYVEDKTTKNGLWYTGKPIEDSTGLSYFGARWYNPKIGRFYGTDPKAFNEGNPLSFNRYAYGNNNPYRFIDPDGRVVVDLIFVGADLYFLATEGATATNLIALGLDVASTFGFGFGAGTIYRVGHAAVEAAHAGEAVRAVEMGTEVAREVESATVKPSALQPGPFAKESIPGHLGRPTAEEQRQVNALMKKNGCHTCGTKDPGTKSGNAVVDHQPPQKLGDTTDFYPHCIDCARRQGGEVLQELIKRDQ
jgi:RHS repeat-associated protein